MAKVRAVEFSDEQRRGAFKTRASKTLQADLDDIFAKFDEHYRLTF